MPALFLHSYNDLKLLVVALRALRSNRDYRDSQRPVTKRGFQIKREMRDDHIEMMLSQFGKIIPIDGRRMRPDYTIPRKGKKNAKRFCSLDLRRLRAKLRQESAAATSSVHLHERPSVSSGTEVDPAQHNHRQNGVVHNNSRD